MGDLWTIRGVSTPVAAGQFAMLGRQLRAAVQTIALDMGLVVKIWDIEIEGPQTGDVLIEWAINDTAAPPTWNELKRIRHTVANTPERMLLRSRPITIDAKNNTTSIRFSWAGGAIDAAVMYLTVTIEFTDIHVQD